MVVRGAGAIGATAAYGLAQGALAFRGRNVDQFIAHVGSRLSSAQGRAAHRVDPVNAMNGVRAAMARRQHRRGTTIARPGRR